MQGASILATFTDPGAESPHQTQFYCMRGNRAIYHRGWKAVAIHKKGTDFDDDVWELYHTSLDYSEVINLADQHPEKLKELIALWWSEAEKYGSLPLTEFSF